VTFPGMGALGALQGSFSVHVGGIGVMHGQCFDRGTFAGGALVESFSHVGGFSWALLPGVFGWLFDPGGLVSAHVFSIGYP
jgi:hypothetical protein